jgi:hypothetical protein
MASLDLTSFAGALKEHYAGQTVQNMVYKNNPWLAMVSKYEKFGGKNYPLPLIYGNPMGRSATFATAQANKTASKIVEFLLTRKQDYALASITNEVLEASMGNANAFMEAATCEIDGAINAAARSLAIGMFGTGSGSLGSIASSSFGVTTITLNNLNDITNFEVGMVLKAATTEAATTLRAGSVTLTGVDRDAGTLTASGNWSAGIAAIAQNDYLVVEGDATNKIKGLQAWLPYVAPTAGDSFFGVDRSVDASRLAGIRQDGSSKPIEEALIDVAARLGREGGSPDICFLDFSSYASLEKALGSKVQYVGEKIADVGFSGLQIQGPKGIIKVFADQNCPSQYGFMLTKDTWKLYSLGAAPKILDSDGMKMLREASADSVEVRVGYYAQLGCNAPGFNGIVKLS